MSERIKTFDKAVISSSDSIRTYYEQLNDLERSEYIDSIRFTPALPLSKTKAAQVFQQTGDKPKLTELPTGLINRFSPADIEARVEALKSLGKFGEGLAALANSDAPDQAEKAIDAAGEDVQSIASHVNTLTGTKGTNFDAYAGSISTLGGIVAKHWLKEKQTDAVRNSINESREPVKALLNLLKDEMPRLQKTILELSAQRALQDRIDFYNEIYKQRVSGREARIKLIENAQRTAFLEETELYAAKLALLQSIRPDALIGNMDQAYTDLLTAFDTQPSFWNIFDGKKTKAERQAAFDALTKSVGAFLEEAQRISDAIDKLKSTTHANAQERQP